MHIQRGAKALIRRQSDGKYLVLTCSEWPDNPRRSQQPDLPGGVVEPLEQFEEGLQREILEETSLDITQSALTLGYCLTYIEDDTTTHFFVFVAEVRGDEPITLSWEHESYEWLSLSELMTVAIRAPYKLVFENLKKIGLLF